MSSEILTVDVLHSQLYTLYKTSKLKTSESVRFAPFCFIKGCELLFC